MSDIKCFSKAIQHKCVVTHHLQSRFLFTGTPKPRNKVPLQTPEAESSRGPTPDRGTKVKRGEYETLTKIGSK